ncbi:hypothetical protein E5F05_20650 [Deinococcus metallilatus]|uniref:Uncharacterized protein n=1 Tax=Deinococcus metallilatus TaxID=1211322 RepID=A0AAJ5JYR3_9DEIO|nr:hypothetical protein [Deinococcus metallilatus]MBB5294383.1 hypothetical protein [Deinococcus metallilatus]QBY10138.1 hypothetical protein E5F05_20650 [Deinococcus metallilatus]RXJ13864.1 hypothetical protein ERJ73_04300 [Deinococcus metallilatus]TLK29830.1 hypothetical protein FCS05_04615 [Deinococcus metallilatus]GMA15599.1 hypothetical protein GCM10025871_19300 [Deinococcus metallilatus]
MNPWRWLTTPDPEPGFTPRKLLKLFVRVAIFALLATLLSAVLRAAGLSRYLDTWWGTLLFVLVLYVPLARFLTVDTFVPQRGAQGRAGTKGKTGLSSAERRKERNRYAGVRKGPPRGTGGRR